MGDLRARRRREDASSSSVVIVVLFHRVSSLDWRQRRDGAVVVVLAEAGRVRDGAFVVLGVYGTTIVFAVFIVGKKG